MFILWIYYGIYSRVDIMILNDRDIMELANHFGRPLVIPFDVKHLTPNGYDLSIKEIKVMDETADKITGIVKPKIFDIKDGDLFIPARTFVIGMTDERVEMPADMVAFLWIRSSYGRKGLILMASVVDAGYCGNLALSMYNCSNDGITIPKDGKRTICQIVFMKMDSTPMATYALRSGNYQNQNTLKV